MLLESYPVLFVRFALVVAFAAVAKRPPIGAARHPRGACLGRAADAAHEHVHSTRRGRRTTASDAGEICPSTCGFAFRREVGRRPRGPPSRRLRRGPRRRVRGSRSERYRACEPQGPSVARTVRHAGLERHRPRRRREPLPDDLGPRPIRRRDRHPAAELVLLQQPVDDVADRDRFVARAILASLEALSNAASGRLTRREPAGRDVPDCARLRRDVGVVGHADHDLAVASREQLRRPGPGGMGPGRCTDRRPA